MPYATNSFIRLLIAITCVICMAGFLPLMAGCALPDVPPAKADATEVAHIDPMSPIPDFVDSSLAYGVQLGDLLDIRYGEQPQYDRESVPVAPDGTISLPFVGSVPAAGRTLQDIEAELRRRHAALASSSHERRYLLQAGDDLELKFPFATPLNESFRVRPDGAIQMQLIGTIRAAGKTPEELQADLEARYARYVRHPSVAVIVRNTATPMVQVGGNSLRAGVELLRPVVMLRHATPRQIFVGGEVGRPGVLTYRMGLTLEQAVIEVGGHRQTAQTQRVLVLRRTQNGTTKVFERDLAAAIPQDMALAPSDIVIVPKTKVAGVGQLLDEYVFKLFPFIRNSSFSYVEQFSR